MRSPVAMWGQSQYNLFGNCGLPFVELCALQYGPSSPFLCSVARSTVVGSARLDASVIELRYNDPRISAQSIDPLLLLPYGSSDERYAKVRRQPLAPSKSVLVHDAQGLFLRNVLGKLGQHLSRDETRILLDGGSIRLNGLGA